MMSVVHMENFNIWLFLFRCFNFVSWQDWRYVSILDVCWLHPPLILIWAGSVTLTWLSIFKSRGLFNGNLLTCFREINHFFIYDSRIFFCLIRNLCLVLAWRSVFSDKNLLVWFIFLDSFTMPDIIKCIIDLLHIGSVSVTPNFITLNHHTLFYLVQIFSNHLWLRSILR